MTDEFYVAATEFNLSWDEIKTLGRNSLEHAFVADEIKDRLLREYNERVERFERQMQRGGVEKLGPMPETRGFICNRYGLCKQTDTRKFGLSGKAILLFIASTQVRRRADSRDPVDYGFFIFSPSPMSATRSSELDSASGGGRGARFDLV